MLWAQSTTKDYIRAEHILHSISTSFISQVIMPQVFFKKKIFLAYLYSADTQLRNLHPAWWPILFCGPTQEPMLATADTGKKKKKIGKSFGKKCRWMGRRVEISKEEIPGSSVACMAIYWPTPGLKGRTFKPVSYTHLTLPTRRTV